MNGTPRLSSAFPDSPQASRRRGLAAPRSGWEQWGNPPAFNGFNTDAPRPEPPSASTPKESPNPVIPLELLDAPIQRIYVLGAYGALFAWRILDFYTLVADETESMWLFMKWIAIDGTFLFGLPALRIPWLEWSSGVMVVLFVLHATFDFLLMFRIGLPLTSVFGLLVKSVYDYEMAISEHMVKADTVFQNGSLIMGRQEIHILPEGWATLNPQGDSFCLGGMQSQVQLPIQINQTTPIEIELVRLDIETQNEDLIIIKGTEAKNMRKSAIRGGPDDPVIMTYIVKKTGHYFINRVVDESHLEVRPRRSHALVVSCPVARVNPTSSDRCVGELSNITIDVTGTPPLRLRYRKSVNQEEAQQVSLQSLQPHGLVSPLVKQQPIGPLVKTDDNDMSWARPQTVTVPLNESLLSGGLWSYEVEHVQDGLGNIVSYSKLFEENEMSRIQAQQLRQSFNVHEKPVAMFSGHDVRNPLKVARGQQARLPVIFSSTSDGLIDEPHNLEYWYTPEQDITSDGKQSQNAVLQRLSFKRPDQTQAIQEPGLYTLSSVSTGHCKGDIMEPSSLIVQNPPEPDLAITTEDIAERCAQRPIGKTAFVDLVGSPPFTITYRIHREGDRLSRMAHEHVQGHKGEFALAPREAGLYKYHFLSISDSVYQSHSIEKKNIMVEQDVKPPPSAIITSHAEVTRGCIDEPVKFTILLQGEAPWTLEYELVRQGKRNKHEIQITEGRYIEILTDRLTVGGDYSFSLTSVSDTSGCTEQLQDEARISVRHQRPQAAFGQIEGKYTTRALEGRTVHLPLRLSGEGPWQIQYELPAQGGDGGNVTANTIIRSPNGGLDVTQPGHYKLVSVADASCPGSIDQAASEFAITWLGRPTLHVTETELVTKTKQLTYVKEPICEGDEDSLDLSFSGSPPYKVVYEEHLRPLSGQKSMRKRDLTGAIGVASIRLESSQAGENEYKFIELSDNNYNHDPKRHDTTVVHQVILPRPSAKFSNPGKTYSFCATDHDDTTAAVETIPIKLIGKAPFSLEVELKHNSAAKPEIINIPNVPSNEYEIRVPHRHLHLGSSALTIRTVRDSRGCNSLPPTIPPPSKNQKGIQERVLLAVHSAPGITPLEPQTNYCVGDRISFALAGQPPFSVYYDFVGDKSEQKKAISQDTTFRRLAEKAGTFTITAVSDAASSCRAPVAEPLGAGLQKVIHALPAVRISKGKLSRVDIHEGGEAEILFEFEGTPPFEFTWTRSELDDRKSGRKGALIETRTATCEGHSLRVKASEEGSYEVVAVRDRWCGVTKVGSGRVGRGDRMVTY